MSDLSFLEKVKLMPPDFQQEVKSYIDYLWGKTKTQEGNDEKPQRIPGALKGKMWMSPDFDETPEDFKDYI
jgi:hypothetical protein